MAFEHIGVKKTALIQARMETDDGDSGVGVKHLELVLKFPLLPDDRTLAGDLSGLQPPHLLEPVPRARPFRRGVVSLKSPAARPPVSNVAHLIFGEWREKTGALVGQLLRYVKIHVKIP